MFFPPTLLFQSCTELASTAGKPQLREGLLREQDTTAQFGPQKEPIRQQIHRMFLLRVKLMHFVNSLHNYIMTRVCVWITCDIFIRAHKIVVDYKCENSTYKRFDHKITCRGGKCFFKIARACVSRDSSCPSCPAAS